jgi:dihydrofolate reductase
MAQRPMPTGRKTVSATVLYMSMSLDGFIAGPNETLENGLGDGGERLHEWALSGADAGERGVPALVSGGVNGRVVEEFMATGVVVAGRGTFKPAGGWRGDHHDGVPIFVLDDGAGTAQLAFAAGVLDESEIHLVPVLFGQGRRLFDNLSPEHIELERTRVLEGEDGATHLRYRVRQRELSATTEHA